MPKPKTEDVKITKEDIEAAKKLWRKEAPPKFRALLDAQPVDEK